MATKSVIISVRVDETGSKKVSDSVKETTKDLSQLTEAEKIQRIEAEKLKITNASVAASFREQAIEQLKVANAGKPLRAQAGLNNAILLEGSRLASDAAYGFQGMANNLGQLVSLFFSFSKTAGGVVNSLKELGKSLLGTGGILIAVQLLIAFGDDIYDFFMGSSKAADEFKKKIDDATQSLRDQAGLFEELNLIRARTNLGFDQLVKTYDRLIYKFPEIEKAAEFLKIDKTDEASLNNFLLKYNELVDARVAEKGALEELKIIRDEINKATKEGDAEKLTQLQDDQTIAVIRYEEALDNLKKLEINLGLDRKKQQKKNKESRRDFVAGQLNFEKEIIESDNRISKSLVSNKDIEIKAEADATKEIAKLKQRDFAERQQRRVDAIKNADDRAKAQKIADRAIADSRTSLNEYLIQIDTETSRKLNQRKLEDLDKATELLEKELNARIIAQEKFEMSMARNDFDRIDIQRQLEEAKTQTVLDNLERQRTAAIVAGEETIGIEQQITNAKEALAETNKKIDRDEADAKLATANYVAQAITAIAGEGSALGKAVSVAMATINTYEAVTAALGAKPYGPWNIAQAAATAAFGFLQVKKILATKLPGGGGSGGGVGGAAPSVEAPDFNVVGASETSQLSMAVARTREEQKVNLVWDDLETYNNIADKTVNIAAF